MPIAKFQLPDGRIARFEVPEGTTPQQAQEIGQRFFSGQTQPSSQSQSIVQPTSSPVQQQIVQSQQPAVTQAKDVTQQLDGGGIIDSVLGAGQAALTIGSGIVAEPIAGLAGIAQSINPFAEEGAGAEAVESVREAITIDPLTESGQQSLQTVGEVLEPISTAISSTENFLGDQTLRLTESPALAAAAKTLPTAVLSALGLGAGGKLAKKTTGLQGTPEAKAIQRVKPQKVEKALVEAAPDIDKLKDVSRSIYSELDDSAIRVKKPAFDSLINKLNAVANESNVDDVLTPKTARVMQQIRGELDNPALRKVSDIDIIRRKVQQAAASLDPTDSRAATKLIDEIDSHLDSLGSNAFTGSAKSKSKDINIKYKAARNLWGRARRSEIISEAMQKASRQATGFENGIRTQLRQILNNKKRNRFFTKDELAAMDDVVKGSTEQNLFKLVGRLGFSEGQATNILGGLAGTAVGTALGGPAGGAITGAVGQFFRKAAQRSTVKNAKLSDAIVKSRNNPKKITEAYLRLTPKSKQSISELSDILTDPRINVDDLLNSSNKLIREAAESAKGRKAFFRLQAAGATAPTALTQQEGR